MFFRLQILLCLSTLGYQSLAQTCCTAGAPISSFLEVNSMDEKSISIQLLYEYKNINLLVDNSERLENDPRSRFGQNVALKFDYTLNNKWAFSLIAPFVHQSRMTFSETQSSLGVGDVSLLAQYMLYANSKTSLNISAGIKLPTGIVSQRGVSGIFLSPDMQSGTGSYDFLIRSSYNHTRFIIPFLTANVSAVFRKNGSNDDFGSTENFGGRSFAFGDEAVALIGLRYLQDYKLGFLIPDISLRYRWGGPNKEQNNTAPNSGGHWLSLPVGFSYVHDDIKSIRLYGEIPIYQKIEGLQITTKFLIGLQMTYLIKKKTTDNLIEIL